MSNKPVIVGFYTAGTPYEDDAKRLEASCEHFGYKQRYVVPVECSEDWILNAYHKPRVMREAMDKFPKSQRFLFLDADCFLKADPKWFEQTNSLLAFHRVNPSNIRLHMNAIRYRALAYPKGAMFNSGIIFYQRTEQNEAMLKEWESSLYSKDNDRHWDQWVFQTTVEKLKTPYSDIPPEYVAGGPIVGHESGAHRHWGESRAKFLLIGSGPEAPEWWERHGKRYREAGFVICAFNHAWSIPGDYLHVWFRPNDYPGPRPIDERLAENRRGYIMTPFWCRSGRISMLDTWYSILNHMTKARRSFDLHLVGQDCVYEGSQTHFYGSGPPDPLKYGPQWLTNELGQFMTLCDHNNVGLFNVSEAEKTALPFNRLDPSKIA